MLGFGLHDGSKFDEDCEEIAAARAVEAGAVEAVVVAGVGTGFESCSMDDDECGCCCYCC